MSTHYLQKFADTATFLAYTPDTSTAEGIGVVSDELFLNRGGAAIRIMTGLHKELTATYLVPTSENGAVYYLNATTEFVTTLPVAALGLQYTFIVKAAPSGASYTVVTDSSSNVIKGNQNSVAGDAGDFGTADDTISFVDGQSVAGDKCEVYSDGTSWFAYAISKVAAGITFTQAS